MKFSELKQGMVLYKVNSDKVSEFKIENLVKEGNSVKVNFKWESASDDISSRGFYETREEAEKVVSHRVGVKQELYIQSMNSKFNELTSLVLDYKQFCESHNLDFVLPIPFEDIVTVKNH